MLASVPADCCHLPTAVTCRLFYLPTAVTCLLLSPADCCHLPTAVTCRLLSPADCCHLPTVVTCRLLSPATDDVAEALALPRDEVTLQVAVPHADAAALALLTANDGVEPVGVGHALVTPVALHQRGADALAWRTHMRIHLYVLIPGFSSHAHH